MRFAYTEPPAFVGPDPLTIALLAVGISLILAFVARDMALKRGRSGAGFFWLSFLIAFPLALIILLVSPRSDGSLKVVGSTGRYAQSSDGDQMRCPYCSEWVNAEATLCRHCGSNIEGALEELLAFEKEETNKRAASVAAVAEGLRQEEENKRAAEAAYQSSTKYRLIVASLAVLIVGGTAAAIFVAYVNRPIIVPVAYPNSSIEEWATSLTQCGISPDGATYTDTGAITINAKALTVTPATLTCFTTKNFGLDYATLKDQVEIKTPSGYYALRDSLDLLYTFSHTPTK